MVLIIITFFTPYRPNDTGHRLFWYWIVACSAPNIYHNQAYRLEA